LHCLFRVLYRCRCVCNFLERGHGLELGHCHSVLFVIAFGFVFFASVDVNSEQQADGKDIKGGSRIELHDGG
jgi:hypothetical protein